MKFDYHQMSMTEKSDLLFLESQFVDPETVRFKINASFLKHHVLEECDREILVSYFPMLPLLEKQVRFEEADYILYMHPYARCDDLSDFVVAELKEIADHRKKGAEIIVVGKAANAEKLLQGSIENITFWGDHFTEKLGKKFGLDIKEEYFVYSDNDQTLNIWPVNGCLQKCKFCRRTFMDIKFESLSLDYIKSNLDYIRETYPERLTNISLRAENLTEYGIDIYGEQMLHHLIDLINSYDEVKNIKFPIGLSIGEITPEILNSICNFKNVSVVAMNLEAGSDRLLKVIGKSHTCQQAIEIFKEIRKAHPNVKFATTVMIGLPTEELTDIYDLVSLIVETKPNWVLCNYYISSPRHPLAKLPQLSESLTNYHLKIFKKQLCSTTVDHEMTVDIRYLYNRPKSRKAIKKMQKIENENKLRAEIGRFPVQVHTSIRTKLVK